jgi:hypothetical protein
MFLRWLNAAFTTCLNINSSHGSIFTSLRISRTTPLCTLGGGIKTCASTVKQILGMVKCLKQNTCNPVIFIAWFGSYNAKPLLFETCQQLKVSALYDLKL